MNAEQFSELLIKLNACDTAMNWAEGKTWGDIYNTCRRGDWLLWLFEKTNPDDKRLLTLVKGHCANTVRHLMRDAKSIAAIDAAIAYGEGRISDEELEKAASDAKAADETHGANAASYTAYISANEYYGADSVAFHASVAADDLTSNIKLTADICRKYLPIEIWNIK